MNDGRKNGRKRIRKKNKLTIINIKILYSI